MRDNSVGEGFPQLFQPDTLLPSQFFAALRRKGKQEPERRLVTALLQDAVECYQKHLYARDHKARQLFADAEEWIMSQDRCYFFSFENVCDLLEINPEFVRRGLVAWRERQRVQRGKGKVYPITPLHEIEEVEPSRLRHVGR